MLNMCLLVWVLAGGGTIHTQMVTISEPRETETQSGTFEARGTRDGGCSVCHTVHRRHCWVERKPRVTSQVVKECRKGTTQCEGGGRVCKVRLEPSCHSRTSYKDIKSLSPSCKVEAVEGRKGRVQKLQCSMVEKKRRKAVPEKVCRKEPVRVCGECKQCGEGQHCTNCFDRLVVTHSLVETERCSYVPRRVCQSVRGKECDRVVTPRNNIAIPSKKFVISSENIVSPAKNVFLSRKNALFPSRKVRNPGWRVTDLNQKVIVPNWKVSDPNTGGSWEVP